MSENCVFCKIASGEIPCDRVYSDDYVLAFNDLTPKAPTHILVIPKRHVANLAEAEETDRELLGRLLLACGDVAARAGIDQTGYRVVTNSGADGGQSVGHLHFHILGGRPLAWPPG
jgi:histidine triad (HIT) family protein